MKKQEVIAYEIYLRSFKDSNGDGIGDLNGVTSKLDYLKDLGINYIWLSPFYKSPQKDNGYDVADYYLIEKMFGTMKDFEVLVKEAKKRNINVMLDMVFNHCSTEHEWFKKAIKGDKHYQDYFYFFDGKKDKLPNNWMSKFGGPAWEYSDELKKWYLHLYDKTQADLNWNNPNVRKEIHKIVNFWKSKGVKGFRFDVINLVSKPTGKWIDDNKGDGRRFYTDGKNIHKFIKEMNNNSFGKDKSFITVGEMSSTSIENCIKYSNPKRQELSMTFNFHHLKVDYPNGKKWTKAKPDIELLKDLFKKWQEEMSKGNGWMANFLSNHDQPRHLSRFGNEKEHYKSATSLAAMYIFLKGTPYIYYGEEIGMTNPNFTSIKDYRDVESINFYNEYLERNVSNKNALEILNVKSRDNGRIPYYWNSKSNAGFTSGKPWINLGKNYKEINLEKDLSSNQSVFRKYL